MAHYEDLTIDQGTDVSIEVSLVNPDNSKKDLTGFSVAAKMATHYNASDSDKIDFTAVVNSPDSDGVINLSLTNLQTDALNPKKRYVYDVEISYVSDSDGDGNLTYIIERVLEGLITVTPSVTK